jgi:hypothetical protein
MMMQHWIYFWSTSIQFAFSQPISETFKLILFPCFPFILPDRYLNPNTNRELRKLTYCNIWSSGLRDRFVIVILLHFILFYFCFSLLWTVYHISVESLCVKFVRYNLKGSYYHHICNCWLNKQCFIHNVL